MLAVHAFSAIGGMKQGVFQRSQIRMSKSETIPNEAIPKRSRNTSPIIPSRNTIPVIPSEARDLQTQRASVSSRFLAALGMTGAGVDVQRFRIAFSFIRYSTIRHCFGF